ncbi:MAG: GAF domain-containing protein [Solirubrobacterales bacterium]
MEGSGLERDQLGRLLEVGRGLVAELDIEGVLAQVLDAARELTGARYAALGVLDENKRELERFIYVGIDEETRRRIGPLPRGHGLLGELIRRPRPLRLAQISHHPRSYGFPAEHPEMTTFAGTPVMIRGEVYGNLYLTEKQDGQEFTDADEQLLIVLAEWAAIAIDNARSHTAIEARRGELERAVRGLEASVELSRELGGEIEIDRVMELIAKRGRALIDARSSLILLVDGNALVVAETAGDVPGDVTGRRLESGIAAALDVLRADVPQRVESRALTALRDLGIDTTNGLLAPLRFRGEPLGVFAALDTVEGTEGFTAGDELLVRSFSITAAAAIAATKALESERLRLTIEASERERERWARELHDETLQELGALKVLQESALRIDTVETMRTALMQAGAQVERVIDEIQGLITQLRPASLGELGTEAALEALAERFAARFEIQIEADIDLAYEQGREPNRHTPELESTIYRIVQEALNNVAKHSRASQVRLLVEERDDAVTVTVDDDGVGFEPGSGRTGFGLIGMRERVALVGGELAVEPRLEGGTRVRATLPVVRASAGAPG